ncbi:hypothetical protein BDY19DRAFT_773067 [Irpex rosettiformis]|uniref:Uncharacterized protein n=1 Tax=Irpex rosettiformis TaxID=378272 RepID=A0ACB8U897_9APHY|nr:hypothetical protein BDY19DRAFT_773067 [Irpex rosettiformis]
MHPLYGAGTSTEPIVISDDEDEAAFVEFTLEQRISSPSDNTDYYNADSSEWQKDHPIYVEDEPSQVAEMGNGLFPSNFEIEFGAGQKRKRTDSMNSLDDSPLWNKPIPRAASPNVLPKETKQARKKRRRRERQAAEAAESQGLSMPVFSPTTESQSSQQPNHKQPRPRFPLPPKPVPVFLPPQPPSPPRALSPSTYMESPVSPISSILPTRLFNATWAQAPLQPSSPVEPPPDLPTLAPYSTPWVSTRHPDTSNQMKKIIGMPPDLDPNSQHGVYFIPPQSLWKPNPARSLVIELLPKRFRTLTFIFDWAGTVCPPGAPPRVELDQKVGKALIEFPSGDIARAAWESPRLYGGGKEHIRAYWYRLPGVGADAGVGELEEGEIEDGELDKVAAVKGSANKLKRNKKHKNISNPPRSATNSNTFPIPPPVPPPASPSPSISSTVTFSDGKWRSTSIVKSEEPPNAPSLPPGARWTYQDGRPVIQYSERRSQERDHLPPPISLSAFVGTDEDCSRLDASPTARFEDYDSDSWSRIYRGFQDGRQVGSNCRPERPMWTDPDYLPPPISLSAFVAPQREIAPPFEANEYMNPDDDSKPIISALRPHKHTASRGGRRNMASSYRDKSLVSDEGESMDIASEDGDALPTGYPPVTEAGSSYAIEPPGAHPELSSQDGLLTGSNKAYALPIVQEESADEDDEGSCTLNLLFPDEPLPRLTVLAPSPRSPVKPAIHTRSGVPDVPASGRSASPSPSPSVTITSSSSFLPKGNTSPSWSTTPTPPAAPAPTKDKVQDLKQMLHAREKELQETIAKTKQAMAAKVASSRSGTGTPVVEAKEEEPFEVPGLTASSTPSPVSTPKLMNTASDSTSGARITAKEDELRRLVLSSRRAKTASKSVETSSTSAMQEVRPVAVVSETTTTMIQVTTTTETTTTETTDLDNLAASFIAETIQTVSAPMKADMPASSTPLSAEAPVFTPLSAYKLTPAHTEPSPGPAVGSSSTTRTMTEKELLIAKQKLLEQKISESKAFMAEYSAAVTKTSKMEVMKTMDERMRYVAVLNFFCHSCRVLLCMVVPPSLSPSFFKIRPEAAEELFMGVFVH